MKSLILLDFSPHIGYSLLLLNFDEKGSPSTEKRGVYCNQNYYEMGRIHVQRLIRLRNIRMAFDDEVVLNDLNLYINDKEFLTLLGPSGCGKTTTLRIIGGFTTPVSGDVLFDGVRINDVPPYRRQINTVFQKYALFPHMNVFENVPSACGCRSGRTRRIPPASAGKDPGDGDPSACAGNAGGCQPEGLKT